MALNDTQIKALKAKERSYKVSDEKGLYLQVTPAGGKLWRLKYRIDGKEKKLAIGPYPEIGLADARLARDEARAKIVRGHDPAFQKQKDKLQRKLGAAETFSALAEEYIQQKMIGDGRAKGTVEKARWFLSLLSPSIGSHPIASIDTVTLLAALNKLTAKGVHETAKKTLSFANRVFQYAVHTGRCEKNPAEQLKGALASPPVKHRAAIIDKKALGGILRAIDDYEGQYTTRLALQIAPHVHVRPGELRQAEWSEFDFDKAEWRIPAHRTKQRRPHAAPLSRQVLEYLTELQIVTGGGKYLFPSVRTVRRPISDNTFNAAFRRMGYEKEEITAHGWRTTFSSLANESGKWNPDAIERALAHGDSDSVRGAYHRATYWDERVKMAQWWSDYLDELKNS